MEGPEIHTSEAVIDNGAFGTRTIRFEIGRLAQQAAGSAVAYLDDDTMLLSFVLEAGQRRRDRGDVLHRGTATADGQAVRDDCRCRGAVRARSGLYRPDPHRHGPDRRGRRSFVARTPRGGLEPPISRL